MRKYVLPVLFIGTMLMIVVMTKTGATLKTPATPHGILNLEFAHNTAKTTAVVNTWAPNNNIGAAKNNTYYDFIFLLFYSVFLFLLVKKIAQIKNSKAALLIAKGALVAGVLDVFENAGMLYTLSGNASESIALLTTIFSVIKWILALTAAVYGVVGLIQLSIKKKAHLLLT
jgi:predicted metal-binding membrane protein